MKKLLLPFFTLLISFSSCRKTGQLYDGNCNGECLTITGKLVVEQTGSGIANTELNFYFDRNSSGFGGLGRTDFLGISKTKSDGTYSFSIPRKDYSGVNGRLVVKPVPPNYVNRNINETDELAVISMFPLPDTIITLNLSIWDASPLRIRVKTGNTTSFDQFYFTQEFRPAFRFNNSVNGRRSFDTTFYRFTATNVLTYISWNTRSLGLNTGSTILRGRDSIIVAAGSSGDVFIQLP